jgi:excisionase family DNA binding protein
VPELRGTKTAPRPISLVKRIITLSELANYLDVPRKALYKLMEIDSSFPVYRIGSKWFADLEEVQEWLIAMHEKQ